LLQNRSTIYQNMQSYTVESFNLIFTAVRTSDLTLIVIIGNSCSVSLNSYFWSLALTYSLYLIQLCIKLRSVEKINGTVTIFVEVCAVQVLVRHSVHTVVLYVVTNVSEAFTAPIYCEWFISSQLL
jgi:hypothetical protein